MSLRLILAALFALSVHAQTEPFRNPALTVEQRVQDLLGRLTMEEKNVVLDHRGPTISRQSGV